MRNPILTKDEAVITRGQCANLRLYIIKGPNGYRWAALSAKTKLGTFACFESASDARDSMADHVRSFKPRAEFRFQAL